MEWPRGLDSRLQYTVGWFAPLACERAAAEALIDEKHGPPTDFIQDPVDNLAYSWGRIGNHNIVITSGPAGVDGLVAAAHATTRMLASFPKIRFGLLVGIGGAIPRIEETNGNLEVDEDRDIRLGDIVVSQPVENHGGVVQYDHYKATEDGLEEKGFLRPPPEVLLNALGRLQAQHEQNPPRVHDIIREFGRTNEYMATERGYKHPGHSYDRLFNPSFRHNGQKSCRACPADQEVVRTQRSNDNPRIHYGTIASGNFVVKGASRRETLVQHLPAAAECLCFEMEAAGLMNNFPCLVIRGMCDYADSHKNDIWHRYAALTAAAFAKELLLSMTDGVVEQAETAEAWMKNRLNTITISAMRTEVEMRLGAVDPSRKRSDIKNDVESVNLKFHEAGQWLLGGEKFQIWKDHPGSFLWLHGPPGSGKTVISSCVISHLCREPVQDNVSRLVLYYYFDFQQKSQAEKRRPLGQMLRSFLLQLSKSNDHRLEKLYELGPQLAELSETELGQILFELTANEDDIKIIIDALDEMEKCEAVCDWMIKTSRMQPRISFLVTSRMERQIEEQLQGKCDRMEMRAASDIQKYVMARIEKYEDRRKWSKESLQKIKLAVIDGAGEMFRWAVCQLDLLLDSPYMDVIDDSQISETLRDLAPTLQETYDQILCRIPNSYKQAIYRLLQLLLVCKRPIYLEEAQEFLSVVRSRKNLSDISKRRGQFQDVTKYCSSLVILRGKESEDRSGDITVLLAHPSVRDYLLYNEMPNEVSFMHFEQAEAHKGISIVGMNYISLLPGPDDVSFDEWYSNLPLTAYAVEYVLAHAFEANGDREILDSLAAFFNDMHAFSIWVVHRAGKSWWYWWVKRRGSSALEDVTVLFAFHVTARYGMVDTMNSLIGHHEEAFIDNILCTEETEHVRLFLILFPDRSPKPAPTAPILTAFDIACAAGDAAMAGLILEKAKLLCPKYGSSWFEEKMEGVLHHDRESLAHIFVSNELFGRPGSQTFKSAILRASQCQNLDLVEILLEEYTDLPRGASWLESTALAACQRRRKHVVCMLLPNRTDPPREVSWMGPAILMACQQNDEEILGELLGACEGHPLDDSWLDQAIIAACQRDNRTIFQRLTSMYIEPPREPSWLGPAIMTASKWGSEHVLQMLLEIWDDLDGDSSSLRIQPREDSAGVQELTAHWSIPGKEASVLKQCLKSDSPGSWDDIPFDTPLQAAAFGNHHTIVEILLKHDDNPDQVCGFFGTALQAAAARGNWLVVEVLLNAGCRSNVMGGYFETPLNACMIQRMRAEKSGVRRSRPYDFDTVSQLLLQHDSMPLREGYELHIALFLEREDLAVRIIENVISNPENGENFHTLETLLCSKDQHGNTPAHISIMRGLSSIVEKLRDHGTAFDIPNAKGQTALHLVAMQSDYSLAQTVFDAVMVSKNPPAVLESTDDNGMTALHHAVQNVGTLRLLKALVYAAKEMSMLKRYLYIQCSNGKTALHYAPRCGGESCSDAVELLLVAAQGEDTLKNYLEVQDQDGCTALHCAAYSRNSHAVTTLLGARANAEAVNAKGQNFIDCANETIFNARPVIDICPLTLISSEHDPRTKDESPVPGIKSRGSLVFNLCLDGIVTSESSIERGRAISYGTLLHKSMELNDTEMLNDVMGGAQFQPSFLDISDAIFGKTPLHMAAEKGSSLAVSLLLAHGAQLHKVDKRMMTALHYAAKAGHTDIVNSILEDHKSKADDPEGGNNTPRFFDSKDGQGKTPLHYAVECECIDDQQRLAIARRLVDSGAAVYRMDNQGKTPLDRAGRGPVAEFLRDLQSMLTYDGSSDEFDSEAGDSDTDEDTKSVKVAGSMSALKRKWTDM